MAFLTIKKLVENENAYNFTDFDNFFNVYQDKDSNYYYNLNSTIYIDIPESRLLTYVCQHDIHWPTISYNLYGTTRLAWVLMKINKITSDLSFKIIPAGSKIKYLDKSDITTIIEKFTER